MRKKPMKCKNICKEVRKLKKAVAADTGMHIQRYTAAARLTAQVNAIGQSYSGNMTVSDFENVLAQLRYYDPAAPSSLVQASGATGSYHKVFFFTSVTGKLTIRNNYQVPCMFRVYRVRVKADTNIDPHTAYTNGLADVGNPSSTSPYVFPSDSPQFNDLWDIEKSYTGYLQPGSQRSFSYTVVDVHYDPSLVDSHAQVYQRANKCTMWLLRVQGVLQHDTVVTTEFTTGQAGFDFQSETIYKVKYPAGADIKYVHIDNALASSFTNGGVTSQIVVDNQTYSQA